MTLSLKKLVRRLFNGSTQNGVDSKCAHGQVLQTISTERCGTAKTVLFVDDEPSILKIRRLIFEALGYSVFTAISGEEALNVFELRQVDAVVLDYLMPGMDGEETARRIRSLRSDIPIILSTGCLTMPERVREVVTVVVEKAARPEDLIEILEQYVRPLLDPRSNGTEACAY
jgi:CheY-like chemotaxis protein